MSKSFTLASSTFSQDIETNKQKEKNDKNRNKQEMSYDRTGEELAIGSSKNKY